MPFPHPGFTRAAALLFFAACAPGAPPPQVEPADLSVLEAEQVRLANDPDGLTRIGIAYYQAGEFTRARDVLAGALALDRRAFRAAVYLGLSNEHLGEWDAALGAYGAAKAMGGSRSERAHVERRLVALTRARLADEARRTVAAEAQLSTAAPEPNTVAVLRFSYLGTDPELRPIETGLTHLIVGDLAKVGRFRLLERERVQALADELALSADGRADPSTAARSGRLLRASSVVQGAIRESGSGMRLDATVVNTADTAIAAESSTSDRLQELIAMEKAVVLDLLSRMGVSLTPAERRAIEERPTADLQAFLAFSRGLEAEDRGDLPAAQRAFQDAIARDPAFHVARARAVSVGRAAAGRPMTVDRLASLIGSGRPGRFGSRGAPAGSRAGQLRAGIQTVAPTLAGKLRPGLLRSAQVRSRVAEALRQDDPARIGKTGEIIGIIPRP